MNRFLFAVFVLLFHSSLFASDWKQSLQHGATAEELQALKQKPNYGSPRFYPRLQADEVPATDTADFKYVLLSSEASFSEAENLRSTIAKNLPEGVKLVVLVEPYDLDHVKRTYSKSISLDRVIFAVSDNISGGFWARDSFPYPVVNSKNELSLVKAEYKRPFWSGPDIAKSLNLEMRNYDFTFVGGNLMADHDGQCFSVKSPRLFDTTENDLKSAYGCKSVHFFKHLQGIGDVDEVVKILPNHKALTNNSAYVQELQELGYEVTLLPSIPNSFRTYANSLTVGQTAFMPTYGVSKDQEAKAVYESLGYKVIGIPSNTLSDDLQGSVHCQTMAYPAISEEALLEALGAKRL